MMNPLCAIAVCWPLAVQPPAPPSQPVPPAAATDRTGLESRLAAFDERIAKITSLAAKFEQRKHTPLLKRPMISRGTVKAKSGRLRWDTLEPAPSTMTIDETEVRVYYPEAKVVEVYPTFGDARGASGGPLPRLAALREQFEIAEIAARQMGVGAGEEPGRYIAVELTPKTPELRGHVKTVRVLLDSRQTLAKRIVITDADDEVTEIEFSDVRTGEEIKDEDVRLVVPSGTRVSRPVPPGVEK